MVLFVSDIHYDHRPPQGDPLISDGEHAERELIACLKHHRPAQVVLLGDLFDAWIEYDDLIPKGLTRLLGLLAMHSDQGVRVTVVTGNHDPWHLNYFENHLGFRLLRQSSCEMMEGYRVCFGHGDREEFGGRLSRWQRFIRSRAVHAIYRGLLPGGMGQWLARTWSRGARSSRLDPNTVEGIRRYAATVLESGYADMAVFGHCHLPSHETYGGGSYVNTGSWALHRSFATLDSRGLRLRTWNANRPKEVLPEEVRPKPVAL